MGADLSRRQAANPRLMATLIAVVVVGILLGSVTRVTGALPVLYWMLECPKCHTRFVVHDCYLVFVGTSSGPFTLPGQGYEGPPLPERYSCAKGCARPLRVIGSIFNPDDAVMDSDEPPYRVQMTEAQAAEWRELIRAAGFDKPALESRRPRPGC